jgi:hypothetical protein
MKNLWSRSEPLRSVRRQRIATVSLDTLNTLNEGFEMSKFSKLTVVTGAIATAFTGALLVNLPAAPALAQSGSRLCGYSAPGASGSYVGLLYEARQNDASYSKQCDEAVSKSWSKIQSDPQLKAMTWTKHYKATCESVGANFESTDSPKDMCSKMEAKKGYLVKKIPAATGATTTYEKQ